MLYNHLQQNEQTYPWHATATSQLAPVPPVTLCATQDAVQQGLLRWLLVLQAGHLLTPESVAEAAAPGVWLLQNGAPLPAPQLAVPQQEPEGPNLFQSSPGGDLPGAGDGRGLSLQHRPPLPPAGHPRQAGLQPFPGEIDSGYEEPSPETGRRLSEAGSSDTQEELVGASDCDSSDAHQWASQAAGRAALHVHNSDPELHSRGHLSRSSGGPQVCLLPPL